MYRGQLDPGTYVTNPSAGNPLGWQVTVPTGWTNPGNSYLYPTALGGPDGKNASGMSVGVAVAFLNDPEVFVNSCDFGSMSDTSSVAELVAAIQAKDDWVVSTPEDVTIAGFSGSRLDVQLPAVAACGADNRLVFGEPGTQNGFYEQGPSQRLRVWVLDVNGRIVALVRESFPATPADKVAEAQAVIESSVITP
jgi:hypothetical protein